MKTLENMTSAERLEYPVTTGALDYFPNAIAYVAHVSKAGNDQHNPGQPMHWSMDKSIGRGDQIGRHLAQRYEADPETGVLHAGNMAWRALEFLERLLVVGWPERVAIGFPDTQAVAKAKVIMVPDYVIDTRPGVLNYVDERGVTRSRADHTPPARPVTR